MITALYDRAYRLINRLSALDIMQVLVLHFDSVKKPAISPEYEFRSLKADEVRAFSEAPSSELRPELTQLIETDSAICFAALYKPALADTHAVAENESALAGYFWLLRDKVPAEMNSGGKRFGGIAVSLPADMLFLFKAFVLKEYRGNALNSQLIAEASEALRADNITSILTTTEWNNAAFLHSVTKTGFRSVGIAAEWIVAGKTFYRCPRKDLSGARFEGAG